MGIERRTCGGLERCRMFTFSRAALGESLLAFGGFECAATPYPPASYKCPGLFEPGGDGEGPSWKGGAKGWWSQASNFFPNKDSNFPLMKGVPSNVYSWDAR